MNDITAWHALLALIFLLCLQQAHGQGDCGISGTLSVADPAACGCGGACFPTYCTPLGTGNCNRQIVSVFLDIPPCYNGTIKAETLNCNPNASGLDLGDFCQVGFTRIDGKDNLLVFIQECHAAPSGSTLPVAITLSADRKDELISYSLTCIEHNSGCPGLEPPCSVILPLSVINWSIRTVGHQVHLTWTMIRGQFLNYLDVLHSRNGIDWELLKRYLPNELVTHPQLNSFLHQAPVRSDNYYRLKEHDQKGNYFYSPILHYHSEETDLFKILGAGPNPCTDFILLETFSSRDTDIEANIIDVNGKVHVHGCHTLFAGKDHIVMETSKLSPGRYDLLILHQGHTYSWPMVKI